MTLEVGKTHDIVVLLNDTQELGLTVKPHSYRLGRAPEFTPRLGSGAPSAGDFDWWRAFVQRQFDLGEGEAEFGQLEGLRTFARGYGVVQWPSGLGPALLPAATSMEGIEPLHLSCNQRIHIVEMSAAPRLIYGAKTGPGALLTHTDGLWAATHTWNAVRPSAAVMHSSVLNVALGVSLRGYGSPDGVKPAVWFAPAYNTNTDLVWNYDRKLWRSVGHRMSYLTPTTGWSSYIEVGSADAPILNTCVAFGRIYFGKKDGLWCYEGGRVYEVEPFYADASDDNFTMMHASHGALYFNIKNRLYRYTGAGNIELLFTYPYEAILGPATTAQEKLYFSVRDQSHCGSLYAYDFRKRGFFRELDLQSEAARHTVHNVVHVTGLGAAGGKLFIAPFESTSLAGALRGTGGPVFEDDSNAASHGWAFGWAGPVGGHSRVARRRTCTASGDILGLRFKLETQGAPTTALEFCIYADDGGSPGMPTGSPLVSVEVPASDVPSSPGVVTGVFASPYVVTGGTVYHLVCQTKDDARDASDYFIAWGIEATDEGTGFWIPNGGYWESGPRHLWVQHLWEVPPAPFGSRVSYLPSRLVGAPPLEYPRQFGGFTRMYTPWLTLGYPALQKFVDEVAIETLSEGMGASIDVGIAIDGREYVALRSFLEEYTSGNFHDFTSALTDEDDGTYADFEWGTWGSEEALFKNAGQDVYLCGARPFDSMSWRMRPGVYHSREFTGSGDILLETWTGSGWRPVYVTENNTKEANWLFAKAGQLSWRPARHWEEHTFQSVTGYWLRMRVVNAPADARQNNQHLYELTLLAHSSETQHYEPLGSVTTVGNATTTLDIAKLATRIALRFDFVGSEEAAAFLKSFKLSFNPVGQGKREIRVVVKAWDDLKRLDGVIEHSGAHVAEAVQSMHDAGILYCVGLPYPTPHSINAQVQLGESILVPMLVYTAQTGKPRLIPRADIPLRIIEG